jgi:hypothetical protein
MVLIAVSEPECLNPLISITLQGRHDTYLKRRGLTKQLLQSAGEVTSAERAVRNETDAEFFQCRQDLLFPVASTSGNIRFEQRSKAERHGPGGSFVRPLSQRPKCFTLPLG